jgi:hypothetical protein
MTPEAAKAAGGILVFQGPAVRAGRHLDDPFGVEQPDGFKTTYAEQPAIPPQKTSILPLSVSVSADQRCRPKLLQEAPAEKMEMPRQFVSRYKQRPSPLRNHQPRGTNTLHKRAHIRDQVGNQQIPEHRQAQRPPCAPASSNLAWVRLGHTYGICVHFKTLFLVGHGSTDL